MIMPSIRNLMKITLFFEYGKCFSQNYGVPVPNSHIQTITHNIIFGLSGCAVAACNACDILGFVVAFYSFCEVISMGLIPALSPICHSLFAQMLHRKIA